MNRPRHDRTRRPSVIVAASANGLLCLAACRGALLWTTKILALTDALSNLVRFHLLLGQRYDTVGVAPLIHGLEFGSLIADKPTGSSPN